MPTHRSSVSTSSSTSTFAFALGVLSIGIGLIEIFAPKKVAHFVGIDEERYNGIIQSMGVRELVNGVGLLSNPGHARPWLWTRIAGDVLDLALLGSAWGTVGANKSRLCAAISSVAGVAAADVVVTSRSLSRYLDEGATA